MDVAYDHVQEETFPEHEAGKKQAAPVQSASLNEEFQDAYKAISSSPWGAKLGGLWGTVKKQSEQYYSEAQREFTATSSSATKSFSDILSRTRALSMKDQNPDLATVNPDSAPTSAPANPADSSTDTTTTRDAPTSSEAPSTERPDSLPADIAKEASSMFTRFRSEASKRLKDIEKAEDAADEALLRFGTNIRNFLREAVTIAPPEDGEGREGDKVLFESKDAEGKRVIHTTRFDAQLHVIHCSGDSFLHDPASKEYEPWSSGFDIDSKTGDIAADLQKYEELRRSMEKLVPEKVEYGTFWRRYYFLRHVIETEEQRRRELLKGAAQATTTTDLSWESDDEEPQTSTPKPSMTATPQPPTNASTTTLTPSSAPTTADATAKPTTATTTTTSTSSAADSTPVDASLLKPTDAPRKSHDQASSADSDASYDLVSGASSRAPGSPKTGAAAAAGKVEESDEEDWE